MNRTLYWYIEELSGTKKDGDCLNFMATEFNPVVYMQQLETAGVSRAEAEVHAKTLSHLVSNCVVLPADLAELERNLTHEIKSLEMRLELKIKDCELRLELKIKDCELRLELKIRELEQRLDAKIASLRAEMRFMHWMNGVTMALVVGLYLRPYL